LRVSVGVFKCVVLGREEDNADQHNSVPEESSNHKRVCPPGGNTHRPVLMPRACRLMASVTQVYGSMHTQDRFGGVKTTISRNAGSQRCVTCSPAASSMITVSTTPFAEAMSVSTSSRLSTSKYSPSRRSLSGV